MLSARTFPLLQARISLRQYHPGIFAQRNFHQDTSLKKERERKVLINTTRSRQGSYPHSFPAWERNATFHTKGMRSFSSSTVGVGKGQGEGEGEGETTTKGKEESGGVGDQAQAQAQAQQQLGWMDRQLDKLIPFLPSTPSVAKEDGLKFNRWLLVPFAVAVQATLGSIFGWSILSEPMSKEFGLLVQSSQDWTTGDLFPVFSTIIGAHGVSAALLGKWQERAGPRASMALGSAFFGGGCLIGSLGVHLHNLPFLVLGYGLLSGVGMGLGYVPPLATLLKWFPDKRGLATGLVSMGFGGGALVSGAATKSLLANYARPPEFLGNVADIDVIFEGGKRMAKVGSELREVVVATKADIASSLFSDLSPGVYLVETGSTGVVPTMAILGGGYLTIMLGSTMMIKNPPPGYETDVLGVKVDQKDSQVVEKKDEWYVPVDAAMRSPQFWHVWLSFACLSSSGMALMSVAKMMMSDIFSKSVPTIVTSSFAANYVMALSAANLSGRVGWSSLSDKIGRKKTFLLMTTGTLPLFLALPYCIETLTQQGEIWPLYAFCGGTMMIISIFGAAYAVTPAFEADLFGSKNVGAIHGRMLTASTVGGVVGPWTLSYQRDTAFQSAVTDLTEKADPAAFVATFGAPKSELTQLIQSKTVSINQLMEIVPPGTIDPSPFLYNTTMYTAASLMAVAALATATLRPINPALKKAVLPEGGK